MRYRTKKWLRFRLNVRVKMLTALYDKPEFIVTWGKAVGDNLLMTPAICEYYRQKKKKVWVLTYFPELFKNNRSVIVFNNHGFEENFFKEKGFKVFIPFYVSCGALLTSRPHIIRQIAEHFNIRLEDDKLKPVYQVDKSELYHKKTKLPLIVIQSTTANSHYPILNKEWYPTRFQEIVCALKDKVEFVQIGRADDSKLHHVHADLRGFTTIREAIGIIASAELFVGLVGFYMHAAKAVNTKSLIIYGGREHPSQSGYPDNINIYTQVHCSPCWKWNDCEYDRKCMHEISSANVVEQIKNYLRLN